jgi:hypothetical protein
VPIYSFQKQKSCSVSEAETEVPSEPASPLPSYRKRKHGKRAKRKKCVRVLFANFTFLGKKVARQVVDTAPTLDVFLGAEHHLPQEAIAKQLNQFKFAGLKSFWAPAFPNPDKDDPKAMRGGVVCFAKAHLASCPLNEAAEDPHVSGAFQHSSPQHIVGCELQLQGSDIILTSGYAKGGDVDAVLHEIAQATNFGKRAFISFADWNLPPEKLSEHPMLAMLKAEIFRSNKVTCKSQHNSQGSEIDYCIASKSLKAIFGEIEVDWQVVWSPHACLVVNLYMQHKFLTKVVQRAPKKLPELPSMSK